jgi:diguanylate cyclase (GGDEF)-like protein
MKFPFGDDLSSELKSAGDPFAGESDVVVLVLTGPDAGTAFPLPPEGLRVGSGPATNVVLHGDGIAGSHARFRRLANGRFRVESLAGEKGVLVDGEPVEARELHDGDCMLLGADTLMRIRYKDHRDAGSLDRFHEALIRDPLTGIANRPYFLRRLEQELSFAKRHGTALSLLLVDIDAFRAVNDEHGQLAGDEVIYSMAHALSNAVRVEDLVARYGGDEFVVFSRGYDAPDGERFGVRLCKAMREQSVSAAGKEFQLTLSIGVAGFPSSRPETSMDLIARTDAALHIAKENGGDQVAVWQDAE